LRMRLQAPAVNLAHLYVSGELNGPHHGEGR
jgi:hypothetical protein